MSGLSPTVVARPPLRMTGLGAVPIGELCVRLLAGRIAECAWETMAKYVVATTAEIPPGGRKIVEVAGRSIGIFNAGGEFFALRNRCPHQGGPLCEGGLSGLLEASA